MKLPKSNNHIQMEPIKFLNSYDDVKDLISKLNNEKIQR